MWWPVSGLSDHEMIVHASRRGRVRTDQGGIFTLVGWPRDRTPWGAGDRINGRYARLETNKGSRFTLHTRQIVDRWVEEDTDAETV